jgi:hypothetical protein
MRHLTSQHPYKYHRWCHHIFWALHAISYRHTYESQNSFFLIHEWHGFAKDPSQHIKTSKWISTRRSTSKGGTRNGLLITFLQESRMSTSSISTIRLCSDLLSEQKPQDPRRTRWLQEKGRWAISPNSRASHPLHSYAFGYDSQSKCDVPWDWLWEACHMARVHWEARCKEFCSKEGPHYQLEQSVRNQLEHDQVQRVLEDKQQSTLFTSLEIPLRFQSRAVLHWLSGLMSHKKVSVWGFRQEKRDDSRSPNGCLHEKPLQRKAERGKKTGINSGTRCPQVSYFEKTCNVCQKYGGTCTR